MKKVILAPDSFKGTMHSREICSVMESVIQKYYPDCGIISLPIADGGEGTVDCLLHIIKGQKRRIVVKGPYFEDITSFYGISEDVAIIEMATAAGLELVEGRSNPFKTTTYGVGELILDAVNYGCRKIILGLGGSCTNDCGAGMAAALGTKFFKENGETFVPTGGSLGQVVSIDNRVTEEFLANVEIVTMCDINAPLFGMQGAAYIYGPQKGAQEEDLILLDEQLRLFSDCIRENLKIDISELPGAGAAGGMGGGAVAFLGASLKNGIDAILDQIHFEKMLPDVEYIFTGEGRLDHQSLSGKAVIGISRRAKKAGVPVIAVVGSFSGNENELKKEGIMHIIQTGECRTSIQEMKAHCWKDLKVAMEKICDELKEVRNNTEVIGIPTNKSM